MTQLTIDENNIYKTLWLTEMIWTESSCEARATQMGIANLFFAMISNKAPHILKHCHPSQSELKIGCRVVQFSLGLPPSSTKQMSYTNLRPIFSERPPKLRYFAVDKLP